MGWTILFSLLIHSNEVLNIMSTLQVGVATSVIDTAEGPKVVIPFKAQVAYQVGNSKSATKDIKANMDSLIAAAEDPENTDVQYDEVFYLPCILRRTSEVTGSVKLGIMRADGTLREVERKTAEASTEDDII